MILCRQYFFARAVENEEGDSIQEYEEDINESDLVEKGEEDIQDEDGDG